MSNYAAISKIILEIMDDKGIYGSHIIKDLQIMRHHLLMIEIPDQLMHFNLFEYVSENSSLLDNFHKDHKIALEPLDQPLYPDDFNVQSRNKSITSSFFEKNVSPIHSPRSRYPVSPFSHSKTNSKDHPLKSQPDLEDIRQKTLAALYSLSGSSYRSPKHSPKAEQTWSRIQTQSPVVVNNLLSKIYDENTEKQAETYHLSPLLSTGKSSYQSLMEPVIRPTTTSQVYRKKTSSIFKKPNLDTDDFRREVKQLTKHPRVIMIKGHNFRAGFQYY